MADAYLMGSIDVTSGGSHMLTDVNDFDVLFGLTQDKTGVTIRFKTPVVDVQPPKFFYMLLGSCTFYFSKPGWSTRSAGTVSIYQKLDGTMEFVFWQESNGSWVRIYTGKAEIKNMGSTQFDLILSLIPGNLLVDYGTADWEPTVMKVVNVNDRMLSSVWVY